MVNDNNIERIERYLTGQMSPEESDVFLADLKKDKQLREEAQMMALMVKEIKKNQAIQDSEVIDEVRIGQEKMKASARARRIRLFKWAASIAAVVLVVIGVTIFNKSYKTGGLLASADSIEVAADSVETLIAQATIDKVFNKYYSPFQMTVSRGADDEKVLKELADLYNKVGTEKELAPVIEELEKRYGFCHVSFDINPQDKEALEYADYVYSHQPYENDIAWYLALAYLKNNEPDKAKKLLKPLADDGNAQAQQLLKELDRL